MTRTCNPWPEVNRLDRDKVVGLLEGTGTACYDSEPTQLLRECLVESLEAGDVFLWQIEESVNWGESA